jgi:hypothetical protein
VPTTAPTVVLTAAPAAAPTGHIALSIKVDGEDIEKWTDDSTQKSFELAMANVVRFVMH